MQLPRLLFSTFLLAAWLASAIKLHPRQAPATDGGVRQVVMNTTLDNDMMVGDAAAAARVSLVGFVSFNLSGVWTTSSSLYQSYGYRGSYLWTRDPQAKAELKFRGTDIYYMSPLFSTASSFTFMTEIQLDNYPRSLVNLAESQTNVSASAIHAANSSSILWSRKGMNNSEHTITLSMAQGAQYAILDALTYTVVMNEESSNPSSPTSSPSETTSKSHLSKPARIALITLASVLAAVIAYVAFRYLSLKRQQQQAEARSRSDGVRRWVDMRWVNASRTNLGVPGGGVVLGDVKDPQGIKMEMSKMEQV